MIANNQKIKILLYFGTETSILDLCVVHGLAGRWQRSGNVFRLRLPNLRHLKSHQETILRNGQTVTCR